MTATSLRGDLRYVPRDDLREVRLGDVLPTQPSLGYDEICCKLGRYTLGKDSTDGRVPESPARRRLTVGGLPTTIKTAVIGPGGVMHLTDGHHTLTSLHESTAGGPDLRVTLRIVADLSALGTTQFWAVMQQNGWAYLKDVHGESLEVRRLPETLALTEFVDDEIRSLLYFARDIGYQSGLVPFQEFYWAEWVRRTDAVDLSDWDRHDHDSYLAAVESLTRAQTSLRPDDIVAHGMTAGELGALPAWNNGLNRHVGEFAKLSRPYEAEKPGKLAYALEFAQLNALDVLSAQRVH